MDRSQLKKAADLATTDPKGAYDLIEKAAAGGNMALDERIAQTYATFLADVATSLESSHKRGSGPLKVSDTSRFIAPRGLQLTVDGEYSDSIRIRYDFEFNVKTSEVSFRVRVVNNSQNTSADGPWVLVDLKMTPRKTANAALSSTYKLVDKVVLGD